MIIAITGLPKSGKSTLISSLVSSLAGDMTGFLTKEIMGTERRTGFEMVDAAGNRKTIARTDSLTGIQVGRFYVDSEVVDEFIRNLRPPRPGQAMYIDEIGQMQLYSKEFRNLVMRHVGAEGDCIVTLSAIYDDPLIESVKEKTDTFTFTVTPDNRDDVERCIRSLYKNRTHIHKLSSQQLAKLKQLMEKYAHELNYVSMRKLFENAIVYVGDGLVEQLDDSHFMVTGKHGVHHVNVSGSQWSCDCALSRGEAPYIQLAECSHYQASMLAE